MYKNILYVIWALENKKQIMPKEVLGRSLAYNCFLPRLSNKIYLYENLKKVKKPKQALYTNAKMLANAIQTNYLIHNVGLDTEVSCILFNDYDLILNQKYMENIDYLSMIRRMLSVFVVHDSIFIDEYQIIESAISGADMIVIDIEYLRAYCELICILENIPQLLNHDIETVVLQIDSIAKEYKNQNKTNNLQIYLNKLISFSYNLGVIPIIRMSSDVDLSLLDTLESFPHCIYTNRDTAKLISKDNIIFTNANVLQNDNLEYDNIDILVFNN